jgi:hypothetical protein
MIAHQINRNLHHEQVKAVLEFVFVNRPLKLIKVLATTGKYNQSVPWVYYECELTGMRRATFISFQDLLEAFWSWLETINLLAISLWERNAVSREIWSAIEAGESIYHKCLGWAQVIEKDFDRRDFPRFWVRIDGETGAIAPYEVVGF